MREAWTSPSTFSRRRTDHGRNDGRSDRLWLFLSYTYFSPRPSSGGNLFDLRPRRIAFGSPSSARPPPCSCGGATWAGYLDNPLFVAAITGNLSSGACGEVKFPVMAAGSRTLPTNRDPGRQHGRWGWKAFICRCCSSVAGNREKFVSA